MTGDVGGAACVAALGGVDEDQARWYASNSARTPRVTLRPDTSGLGEMFHWDRDDPAQATIT